MRTYIFQESDSSERGCNKCIVVHRIKRNRPHYVGTCNRSTASWKSAHGEAVTIIHECDGIRYATKADGTVDRYKLFAELGSADKYEDNGHYRDAVRLFSI